MNLSQHQSKEQGLSDLLNYAHFVGEGVILNKDGAFVKSFLFQGPDLYSVSSEELDSITTMLNRMMGYLGDGWMVHVDEVRVPSFRYPPPCPFPDGVSALIDDERREIYLSEGEHYENMQYLTFVWKFPMSKVKVSKHWFVEGLETESNEDNLSKLLVQFQETTDQCISLLSNHIYFSPLSSAELLSFLNLCITGKSAMVTVPPDGLFVDVALGREPIVGGFVPKVGEQSLYVLSIMGYINEDTIPGILSELTTYPTVYRWSNRFIPLSESTAETEIKRYQRNWNNKVKGFMGIVRETVTGRISDKVNVDALRMSEEATYALTANSSQETRFGYWSSQIVLFNEDMAILEEVAKALRRYMEQCGFGVLAETVNAIDAWLGTIPGHGSCNIRRLFISTFNFAHFIPLQSVWAGAITGPKSSLLPKDHPPVFYAATTGKTPFRYFIDVGDVGHQIVLGPTGAGKSTFLGFLIAQFLRYDKAEVFVFDKDFSHKALTIALSGNHYDIGNAEELSFCPLSDLSTQSLCVMAEQFIEDLVVLQGVPLNPDIRAAIHTAIQQLALDERGESRNLTVFRSVVQHEEVRKAIQYYTLEGQISLLDATVDTLKTKHIQTFEMNWVLSQRPEIYIPILRYIFDQIERRLEKNQGRIPTLIVLEEAWLYLSHPLFATKLKDWLKTLRKKNARIVFATQSLADLYDPTTKALTATTAAILESCPTKVYLPNREMSQAIKELYERMGLTERQIEIIKDVGEPKRHYYVMTPQGNRLIELGFSGMDTVALSFIGLSVARGNDLLGFKEKYEDKWVYYWLVENGLVEWAEYWLKEYYQVEEIGEGRK
ncbi:MAG: conjugal transfer ATPase TrbE [Gammaproteobacteria bacterium]|jgi:type IV secretion system protein VirB4|nr:conjugal transfer ATPase TrbE [Gammaproteobacteria bacterium]